MKHEHSERSERRPLTFLLGEHDLRELVARAAQRAVAEGRPVSVSEIARDVVRAGLLAQHRGPEAA